MNMDLEDQLRLDMERATRDVRVPHGLAGKAERRRRKRQTTRLVTGALAAVVAGGVAIAGATGAFGSAPSPASVRNAQLTAFVIRHVQSALAPSETNNIVGVVRQTYPPGTTVELSPGGMSVATGGNAAPRWTVGYSVVWAYRGLTSEEAYTAAGQPVFETGLTHANGIGTETAVIYANRTWWSAPLATHSPGPVGCLRGGGVYLRPGPGGGWPGFIRSQLACGAYIVVGRQVINGIDAIKLTGTAETSITLWVDPSTYRPVQVTTGPMQWSFQWLLANRANLAPLRVVVPAGYQQVQPPARPGS
jgi:hypothetical protein